jgi:hypothetical protein
MMRLALVAAVFALAVVPLSARAQDATQTAALREDLHVLANAIRTKHAAPFHAIDPAAFDREVAELDARLPTLSKERALLEMQRIVASVGDGHTSLRLFAMHGAAGLFERYPVRFYKFTDGWFVRSADDRYASIRGGRVVSIAGLTPEALAERLAPYVSRDNEMTIRDRVPFLMASPNVLRALGLAGADGAAPIAVDLGGKTVTATLDLTKPAGELRSMRDPAAPVPLWERNPDKAFWYDYDSATKLLYIGYNEVTDTPQQTARAFFDDVFTFAAAHPLDRCVIDLRHNGGGNGFLNKPMIVDLLRLPQLDRDGTLFAVLGRSTFSAAQMAVSDLERWTNVTFAGEPGGATPNHYGEGRPTVLPRSGLVLSISTLYWQTSNAMDKRDAVKPVIDAELSSADERAGVDPVLKAIARYVPLRDALAADLHQADPDGIARVVRRYTGDPMYRYADFENAINRLGYEELGARRTPNALALFRANVSAYPQSWNAYDSLGEALLAAGLVPDSAAAYRHALQLAPDSVKARIRAIVTKLGG